jgi:proprotein convertase subtilisin/kexin type 5
VIFKGSCIDKCPLGYTEDVIVIPKNERNSSASTISAIINKRIELLRRLTNKALNSDNISTGNIISQNYNLKSTNIVKALEKNYAKFSEKSETVSNQTPNFSIGYFKICRKCGKGCEKCSKENSNECLKCEESLALQNGECKEACSNDNSSLIIEGYCTQCDQIYSSFDNCAKCEASEINPNRKTSKNEKIKTQILQSLKNLKHKSGRVSTQEAKSFRINSLSDLKGVYDITCSECKKNFYLNSFDNKCVIECPPQTFKTKTSTGKLVCDICHEGCKSCESSLKCTECFEGLNLNSNGSCDHGVGCEGKKMFYSIKFKKCLKCDLENCLKCHSNSVDQKCKVCESGSYLDMKNKVCVKNCPKETYFNDVKNYCGECPENCSNCDSNKQCKKCFDEFLFEEGFCVERCSENYVEKDFTCKRCEDINCKICNRNNLSKCEVCDENYKLENGECKTLCSNGYYQEVISEDNVECKPCGDNCDTCLDDKTCLKCLNFKITSNRMLNLFDFNQHAIKYISIDNEKNILKNKGAFSNRIIRNNKRHNSQNILYNVIYFLKNNFCIRDCGENYATDHINQICKRCTDANCLKCYSDNEQICEACQAGFLLANGKCQNSCTQGTFINSAKNTCEKCNSEFCHSCKNAQICDSCKSPKVLLDGNCLDERCPSGFININASCKKCIVEDCETCSQDLTQCYRCKHNFSLVKQKNICVPSGGCPESYYLNVEHKQCEKCPDSNCLLCLSENPYTCVNCNSITTLVNKKCESRCQKTSVFVDKKGKCIECDEDLKATCLVCDPLDLKRCLRCDQQQILKYLFKGKCHENCPTKSYLEKQTNECTECPQNCDECGKEYKCDKCQVGFYLNENNECVKACLNGFIANEKNQCKKCKTENLCKICDIKDKSKCIECKNGLFIDLVHNKCLDKCPLGTIVSGSSCLSCGSYCLECESFDTCKTCKEGFILYEGKCIEKCPLGFVANLEAMKCVQCSIKDCVSCSNDQNKCFSCKSGKALYKNACVEVCPKTTVDNDKIGYCIGK